MANQTLERTGVHAMTSTQYFLIRRVHSLLGVIPLGVFLFAHMTTNSMALFGIEPFDHKVQLIHSLGPLLPVVEAVMIFIPLALHIVIGIVIALTGKSNVGQLGYGRNWAYSFQRWSGWVALAFIIYHTLSLRFIGVAAEEGFYGHLAVMFKKPWFTVLYFVGSLAVIYHFANGLCTFCMTWGITIGPKSQKNMAIAATIVGLALAGMMLASIAGFVMAEIPEQPTFPASTYYLGGH